MTFATLDYESPGRVRPKEASLKWLAAYAGLCLGLCLYSIVGIRFVQWKFGLGEIWEPASGRSAFDEWLIGFPMHAIAVLTLLWSAIGVYWLFTGAWRSAVGLWLSIWPIFFCVELLMIFLVWEPVSP